MYFLGKGNLSDLAALSKSIWYSDPQEMSLAKRDVEYKVAN